MNLYGDVVMIRVCLERFLSGIIKIIHTRFTSPYNIIREIGENTYEFEILQELGTSVVFNSTVSATLYPVDSTLTIPNLSPFLATDA